MLIKFLYLFAGLGVLVKGADWLVNGSSALARKFRVSDLAIGLTIVAFGTSAPELVVNVIATWENHHDIVFGNIIGSNNFNLFIILGISGLITPLFVRSSTVWKEIPLSLLAAVILLAFTNGIVNGGNLKVDRWEGFILMLLYAGFVFYIYRNLKQEETKVSGATEQSTFKIWALILMGLAGLVIGGKLIVDNAVLIAKNYGISEKVIGITILAAGTSLPELATSIVSALKKNVDIAVGNIIGSNIFNILFIISVSSFIRPVSYNLKFNADLLILVGGTLFLFLAMFTGQKKKLDRWEAGILLAFYVGYLGYLVVRS